MMMSFFARLSKKKFVVCLLVFCCFSVIVLANQKPHALQRSWKLSLKKGHPQKRYRPTQASPALDQEVLWTGSQSGWLYSVSLKTGKILTQFKAESAIEMAPFITSSTVDVGDTKGNFYHLTKQGELLWKVYLGSELISTPVMSANSLFVVTSAHELYRINQADGTIENREVITTFDKSITMHGESALFLANSQIMVALSDGQIISYGLDFKPLWKQTVGQTEAPFWDVDSGIVLDSGNLYGISYAGVVFCLDAKNGNFIWKQKGKGGSSVVVNDGHLVYTGTDGHFVSLLASSGAKEYEVSLLGVLTSPQLLSDSRWLVGNLDGAIWILDPDGKIVSRYQQNKKEGFFSKIVLFDGALYYVSAKGNLIKLLLPS